MEEAQALYRSGNGYYIGDTNDFNEKYVLDETRFLALLETTPKRRARKTTTLFRLEVKDPRALRPSSQKIRNLRLLRKGLEVEDAHFTLLYQLPMASSSQTVKENFEKNEFSVTRQIRYNLENTREEIDMVVLSTVWQLLL